MRVLKVTAEGTLTSFRYPFFMQEVQPTFEMPPPSTIYGHIASALGDWFAPEGVCFAVHFTYAAKFQDIEHTHVLSTKKGYWPKRKDLQAAGWTHEVNIGGSVAPFRREILFAPRLTLYINRPDWLEAFRHPRYVVTLGRSQDLMTYRRVEIVELVRREQAYLEHTLLPYDFARRTARGVTVQMPRFLDYGQRRHPTFARYVVLHQRIHARDLLRFDDEPPLSFWVDPTSPEVKGDYLGLVFHTWVDGNAQATNRLAG